MNTASKRGTKPLTPAQKKEREKRVEDIRKDMLEKIRNVDQNFQVELKERLGYLRNPRSLKEGTET